MRTLAVLLVGLVTLSQAAAEEPSDLAKVEAALKAAPDDPTLNYRKCQALFARGKEQEAIDHAAVALTKFKEAKNDLASMELGSFTAGPHKIDVHYNMGRSERAEKKDGIVRPYSFRVKLKAPHPKVKVLRVVDFELGYLGGELLTAALGETRGRRHINLGAVDPQSDFTTVKKKVLELIARPIRAGR